MFNEGQINSINKRYTDRLRVHGNSPLTLGWASKQQQSERFGRFINYFDCDGKTVVDIGCGLGDFASYIYDRGRTPSRFIGVDINQDLLDAASVIHDSEISISFMCGNILDKSFFEQISDTNPDIVTAAGVFNLNFYRSSSKMTAFMKCMIDAMIDLSPKQILIDFIPTHRSDSYAAEEYIATYNIGEIVEFLADRNVQFLLDLSQRPNPMTEALLVIELS